MLPVASSSYAAPVGPIHPASARRVRAFTLIEILAVIAIIGVFIALIGNTKNDGTTGLSAGQGTVQGLLTMARAQAMLSQGNARFLVNANPTDPERYLRRVQVVVPDPADPTNKWITKGDSLELPPGIFVVPPNTVYVPPAPNDGTRRYSVFNTGSTTNTAVTMKVDSQPDALYFYVQFTPRGTVPSGNRIALAVGKSAPPVNGVASSAITFDNPENVRGVSISSYGAQTLLNNVLDFN